MRIIRPQRNFGIDPREESITRVRDKPSLLSVYRKDTGTSTIRGGRSEVFVGMFLGRVDIFGLGKGSYKELPSGQGGWERARLELPYPTDANGNVVNIKREDRVVYNGVNFTITDVIIDDGYIVAGMEIIR